MSKLHPSQGFQKGKRHWNFKHGDSHKTPEWKTWISMIKRCSETRWKDYNGRGIRVCLGLKTYTTFLACVGKRPSSRYTLDRKDNDGNYSCGQCAECTRKQWDSNCRWATKLQQCNNKRNNVRLTFNGERLTVSQWSKRLRIPKSTIANRIRRNWPVEQMLSRIRKINQWR